MAIEGTFYKRRYFIGLSTDSKPTENISPLDTFYEINLSGVITKEYVWDGDSWAEKQSSADVSDRAGRLLGVVSDYAPALKVYESGTVLYVCTAAPGSILTNAVWRIMKVDTTTGVIITWCDGNSNYDNLATSLAVVAALSYS